MNKEFSEQEQVRRDKIEEIKKYTNPYPDRYDVTHKLYEARLLEDGTKNVKIAGRIVFMRKLGKLSFIRLKDIEGDIQVQLKSDVTNEADYEFFKKLVDVGDFLGAEGEIITTQTGEKSLLATNIKFLGKALRPLPEKFHGLQDTELKYRQRYVDLISNDESRNVFLGRSKVYAFLHKFFAENGFYEVETPIIQTAVSGATAKPFFTHHNALNMDCNLRIAPECYLKECIAGGFDRVYELAKCFRNEGMDPQHLQEFTQVEYYVAYWNFEDNVKFFTKFIQELFKEVLGTTVINYRGNEIDFGKDNWDRIDYCEELTKVLGFNALEINSVDELKEKVVNNGLYTYADLEEYKSVGQVIDYIYKKKIRANIIEPTVIYNYPAVLKPLARRNDEDSTRTDVFQVVVCGTELCNAYSELVNPFEQRESFEEQLRNKENGDDEAMDLDEDYLLAMEQGMPPISGLGFGIDRLIMLMYNQESVRDVVLFPMMKDEK